MVTHTHTHTSQLVSQTAAELRTTHTTPQKHYVDDQTMGFKPGTNGGCVVSVSEINDAFFVHVHVGWLNCGLSVNFSELANQEVLSLFLSLSLSVPPSLPPPGHRVTPHLRLGMLFSTLAPTTAICVTWLMGQVSPSLPVLRRQPMTRPVPSTPAITAPSTEQTGPCSPVTLYGYVILRNPCNFLANTI